MLVLKRNIGQKLRIGDDITLVFFESEYNRKAVKIGIEAPPHVKVHRQEIYDIIQQEKLK